MSHENVMLLLGMTLIAGRYWLQWKIAEAQLKRHQQDAGKTRKLADN